MHMQAIPSCHWAKHLFDSLCHVPACGGDNAENAQVQQPHCFGLTQMESCALPALHVSAVGPEW